MRRAVASRRSKLWERAAAGLSFYRVGRESYGDDAFAVHLALLFFAVLTCLFVLFSFDHFETLYLARSVLISSSYGPYRFRGIVNNE